MQLLLQEYGPKEWGGLTTENHFNAIFQREPQKASQLTSLVLQAKYGMTFEDFLNQMPIKYLDLDDDFVWDLVGSGKKNIPLLVASLTEGGAQVAANAQVGIGGSVFYMTFPEPYFSQTQVIQGEKGNSYQIRLVENGVNLGGGYCYKAQFLGGNADAYIPAAVLAAGKRWAIMGSLSETTLSSRGSGVTHTSPYRMRNTFTQFRKEFTVPGNMIQRPLGITIADASSGSTKKFTMWRNMLEFDFDRQYRDEVSKMLYYSTLNRGINGQYINFGDSGYILRMGAGFRQQIESSNLAYYPTGVFDIDWLTDVLLDLSVNKLSGDQRHFMLRTGERGFVQFHRALQSFSAQYTPVTTEERIFKSGAGGNGLGYRGQFIEYWGPQGIRVTLAHEPLKDDPIMNIIQHPNGGPAESYVYDIMDIGTSNGEPNIQKVMQKGMENIIGYEAGLRNPFFPGGGANNMMSTSVDGYKYHRMFIGGVMVKDPTRCMILKPSILA